MTIHFHVAQRPRMTGPYTGPWTCDFCRTPDNRARTPDGKWSTNCVTCEPKFLAAITAHRNKTKPMWFLGRK